MNQAQQKLWLLLIAVFLNTGFPVEGNLPAQTCSTEKMHVRYHLIDLGESDVPIERLKKNSPLPTLAPAINNCGQIIGNRSEGGFLRDPMIGEWVPYANGVTINFHALTNHGDILVSINRKSNPTEWMVWPTTAGKNGPRESIPTAEFTNAYFIGLTNCRMVIGNAMIDGKSKPIFWKTGRKVVVAAEGCEKGKNLVGIFRSVNNQGIAVGFLEKGEVSPPASWNAVFGVEFMRNFRSKVTPDGEVELADLLVAEDGTVYGTYCIKYSSSDKKSGYYTYAWLPYEGGGFKLLDLDGMRISALNDWHVLAGSLEEEAAICEPGLKPIKLAATIKSDELKGWELLEATGINNWGDIVGYGKYNGRPHAFLVQKAGNQAPYNRE